MVIKKTTTKRASALAKTSPETMKQLSRLACDANAAWLKAETAQTRADDLRITAARHLAEAKALCERDGVKFKEWCEDNVKIAYNTAREIAPIGAIKGEKAQMAALMDLRAKTAKRVAKSRAKATAKRAQSSAPDRRVEGARAAPELVALDVVKALGEKERVAIVKEIAPACGLVVGTKAQVARAGHDVGSVKAAIGSLGVSDRVRVLEWLAKECGATVTLPKAIEGDGGDLLDIPPFLRRQTENAGKARASRKRASAKSK